MSSRFDILAFGDSHLDAIRSGYDATMLANKTLPVSMIFNRFSGSLGPDRISCLSEIISSNSPVHAMVCSIDGNAYFVHGAVNNPRRFDLILPHAPDLPVSAGAELIPYDLMREKLVSDLRPLMTAVNAVTSRGDVPVYKISPPPPVGNPEAIARAINLIAKRVQGDVWLKWQRDLGTLGVAPPPLRYKLWCALLDAMRQLCREFRIYFIEAPAAAKDSEGFLREEYCLDGFHGNSSYGQLVVQQLIEIAQSPMTAD